ncbi:MAG: hypothetical protein ACXW2E_00565 [Nitrososphaeraceae archaeon]
MEYGVLEAVIVTCLVFIVGFVLYVIIGLIQYIIYWTLDKPNNSDNWLSSSIAKLVGYTQVGYTWVRTTHLKRGDSVLPRMYSMDIYCYVVCCVALLPVVALLYINFPLTVLFFNLAVLMVFSIKYIVRTSRSKG